MNTLLALISLVTTNTPFPDTPSGKFAAELVAAIDQGNPSVIESFSRKYGTRDPLTGSSPDQLKKVLFHGHRQSGGVTVTEIETGPQGLQFMLNARRGGKTRVIVDQDASGTTRFEFRPLRKLANWPKVKDLNGAARLIREHLDQLAKKDEWSGVALLAKGDQIIMRTSHGFADRAERIPITLNSKFDIASTGKLFTAALIAREVDQGKIRLEDRIGQWLPNWPDETLREKATIRDLLGHTAGTGTVFDSPGYDRSLRYGSAEEMSEAMHGEKLEFEPGTNWSYSNGGFVLLGAILERLHQKSFSEIAHEQLWGPLGMSATGIVGRTQVEPSLTRIYDRNPIDLFGKDPKELDRMNYGWIGGPHGGGHSTAGDLFKFARAWRKGKLMSAETLQKFITAGELNPTYGLGTVVSRKDGVLSFGHHGHARSDLTIFWDADLTLIVLGNDLSSPAPLIAREIKDLIRPLLENKTESKGP